MSWHPDTIEAVRAAADILLVIEEVVPLKRRGKYWVGLCPFHAEKTPSFTVTPDKGLFKCFGCGKGGDVFTFVMEYERVSFPEAVRILAERFGVPLPEPGGPRAKGDQALYEALGQAARFFYRHLRNPTGQKAQRYLAARGISDAIARRFGLGYAPASADALYRHVRALGMDPRPFAQANLLIPGPGGTYRDRFRDRLMFPILSASGRVVGFAGRLLKEVPNQPKYVNTAETPLYRKGRLLYGLYQAREAIRARGEALLVEGYADVLALHEYGFEQAVASGGTALTAAQARLLARYSQRVVILYDADPAGLMATLRATELLLAENLEVRVLRLPEGDDPDSFLRREGREGFLAYREREECDFLRFLLARELPATPSPEAQARAAHEALRLIALIPDVLRRTAYVRALAEALRMPEAELQAALEQRARSGSPGPSAARPVRLEPSAEALSPQPSALQPDIPPPERLLLRLMLEHGGALVRHVFSHTSLEEFQEGPSRELARRLLETYQRGEPIEIPRWIRELEGTSPGALMLDVLIDPHELSPGWRERRLVAGQPEPDPHEAAADAIKRLKRWNLERLIEQNSRMIRQQSLLGGDVEELLRTQLELSRYLAWLEAARFPPPETETQDSHASGGEPEDSMGR